MGGRSAALAVGEAQASAPARLSDEVPRASLLSLIRRRWSTPLVLIDAPGGYGKSTLLGQAVRDNAADPAGRDVYIPLIDADRDPAILLRTVLRRLGQPGTSDQPDATLLEAVLDLLRLQSPDQVALLFDDVHWVADADGVRRLFAELLHQLPANVHIVLAGRELPKVPIARLLASDDVLQINEGDLLFSEAEMAQLAHHHHVDTAELASTAGWPAVARLAATAGREKSLDFMMEEVVDGLDDATRTALATLLLAGVADHALFTRVGLEVTVDELAARVPLVDALADGSIRPHDLWREASEHLLEPEDRLRTAGVVAEWQLDSRRPDAAIGVAAEAGLWEVARRAVCSTISEGDAMLTATTAERWLSLFPPEQADEPEVLLLEGVVQRLRHGLGHGIELIDRAHQLFMERDDVDGEIAAAWEVGMEAWSRNDVPKVLDIYQRAVAMAALGVGDLDVVVGMVDATMADMQGEFGRAIDIFAGLDYASAPSEIAVLGLRHWSTLLFLEGRSEEGVEVARRAVERFPYEMTRFILDKARFQNGEVEHLRGAWPPARPVSSDNARDQFLIGVFTAMVDASFGLPPDLAFSGLGADRSREHAFIALTKAMAEVTAGDEGAAQQTLARHLQQIGLEDPMNLSELCRFVPYAYVLSHESRPHLDAHHLGPKLAERRAIARALVGSREGRPVDWGRLPAPTEIFTALPLRWTVELASRAATQDLRWAIELSELALDLTGLRARALLRDFESLDGNVGAGAKQLLAAVPAEPGTVLEVKLCGELRVGPAGEQPDYPRRGRVRQLLALLALRERVTRDEAMALLWPDTDVGRARNNLRVTLGYLRALLEPDRRSGEASFHLRQHGDVLALHRSAALDVDTWRMVEAVSLGRSLEDRSRHAEAAEQYAVAAELWEGEPYRDLRGLVELLPELSAGDDLLAQAAARAGEWLYTEAEFSRVKVLAERILRHDPYAERAHRLLVSALLGLERYDDARDARARCLATLDELGVAPTDQTKMVLRRLDRAAMGMAS